MASIGSLKFFNLLRIPPLRVLIKQSRKEVEDEAAFSKAIGQATQEFQLRWEDIQSRIRNIEERRAADKVELQGLQKESNRLKHNLQASIELQQTEARLEVLRAKKARLDASTDLSGPLTTTCNLTVSLRTWRVGSSGRHKERRQRNHPVRGLVNRRYHPPLNRSPSLSSRLHGKKQSTRR